MFRRLSVPIIVTVLLTMVLAACGGSDDPGDEAGTSSPPPPASAPTVAAPTAAAQPALSGDGVTKFAVENQDPGGTGEYKFVPSQLQFSVGETVEFTITAETEFHTFTIDELNIDQALDAGEAITFTFTFDTPGEYRLICIPHEALGMEGTLIVK